MNCKKCEEEIERYEHYVVLKDGTLLCESCFFDKALKEFQATSKQEGFDED